MTIGADYVFLDSIGQDSLECDRVFVREWDPPEELPVGYVKTIASLGIVLNNYIDIAALRQLVIRLDSMGYAAHVRLHPRAPSRVARSVNSFANTGSPDQSLEDFVRTVDAVLCNETSAIESVMRVGRPVVVILGLTDSDVSTEDMRIYGRPIVQLPAVEDELAAALANPLSTQQFQDAAGRFPSWSDGLRQLCAAIARRRS